MNSEKELNKLHSNLVILVFGTGKLKKENILRQ